MTRHWPASVKDQELTCLNIWPEGTDNFQCEQELIHHLNDLCQQFGYGRIPQLTAAMEEIWRRPDVAIPKWQAARDEQLAFIASVSKKPKLVAKQRRTVIWSGDASNDLEIKDVDRSNCDAAISQLLKDGTIESGYYDLTLVVDNVEVDFEILIA